MSITPEQRALRKKFVGASDVAAILGLNPYRTPADVYLEKTRDLPEQKSTDDIDAGNDLERPVLAWAERKLGEPLIYGSPEFIADNKIMMAHPDALVEQSGSPVEAKVTALEDDWGPSGTDQIPQMHLVQVYSHTICMKVDRAYVAAHLAGVRSLSGMRRLYKIEKKQELADEIEDLVCGWWCAHVVKGVPPEDATPSLDLVKRIRPIIGRTVELADTSLFESVASCRTERLEWEKREQDAAARLLMAMDGADYARGPDGYTASNKTIHVAASTKPRNGYSFDRLTVKKGRT
jgi:putative phage-type endonuclease